MKINVQTEKIFTEIRLIVDEFQREEINTESFRQLWQKHSFHKYQEPFILFDIINDYFARLKRKIHNYLLYMLDTTDKFNLICTNDEFINILIFLEEGNQNCKYEFEYTKIIRLYKFYKLNENTQCKKN